MNRTECWKGVCSACACFSLLPPFLSDAAPIPPVDLLNRLTPSQVSNGVCQLEDAEPGVKNASGLFIGKARRLTPAPADRGYAAPRRRALPEMVQ